MTNIMTNTTTLTTDPCHVCGTCQYFDHSTCFCYNPARCHPDDPDQSCFAEARQGEEYSLGCTSWRVRVDSVNEFKRHCDEQSADTLAQWLAEGPDVDEEIDFEIDDDVWQDVIVGVLTDKITQDQPRAYVWRIDGLVRNEEGQPLAINRSAILTDELRADDALAKWLKDHQEVDFDPKVVRTDARTGGRMFGEFRDKTDPGGECRLEIYRVWSASDK